MNKTAYTIPLLFLTVLGSSGCGQEAQVAPAQGRANAFMGGPPTSSSNFMRANPLAGNDLTPVAPGDVAKSSEKDASKPELQVPSSARVSQAEYHSDAGGDIEVEAVCSVGEDDIHCWKPDGSPNDAYATRLKTELDNQRSLTQAPKMAFPIQYGMKNRLIAFKVTQRAGNSFAYLSIGAIGSDANQGMAPAGPVFSSNSTEGGYPSYERHESRFVAVDKSEKTTVAHITEYAPISRQASLTNAVGSKADFGDESYVLDSVEKKAQTRPDAHPLWILKLRKTHSNGDLVRLTLTALDAQGKPILYSDGKGGPISDEEYKKRIRTFQRDVATKGPGQEMSAFGLNMAVGDQAITKDLITIKLNVNPVGISRFVLSGGAARQIELSGIALDPSRPAGK